MNEVLSSVTLDSQRYASIVGLDPETPLGIVADKLDEQVKHTAAKRLRAGHRADETIVLGEELGPEYYTFRAVYGEAYHIYRRGRWGIFNKIIAFINPTNRTIDLYDHDMAEKIGILFPGLQIIFSTEH